MRIRRFEFARGIIFETAGMDNQMKFLKVFYEAAGVVFAGSIGGGKS